MMKRQYLLVWSIIITLLSPFIFGWNFFAIFGCFYLLLILAIDSLGKLTPGKKTLYIIGYSYPFFEYLIKYIGQLETNSLNAAITNRIEHAVFTIIITYLSFIIVKSRFNYSKAISSILYIQILFSVLIVNVLGILNEIFEFIIRLLNNKHYQFSIYYPDTIFDLTTNLVFSLLTGVYLAISLIKKYEKKVH